MARAAGLWSAVGTEHAENLAHNPDLAIDLRLHAAITARKRRHSDVVEFAPKELREILSTVDKRSGELKPRSRQTVNLAINRAIAAGSLLPGSSLPRLYLSPQAFPTGYGS